MRNGETRIGMKVKHSSSGKAKTNLKRTRKVSQPHGNFYRKLSDKTREIKGA